MKKIEVSVAVVRNQNNSFYFQKRAKNPYKGYFGLIGGKVEEGEAIQECLVREVYEESSLRLRNVNYVGIVNEKLTRDFEKIEVKLHIFETDTKDKVKANKEEGTIFSISPEFFLNNKTAFIPTDWLITKRILNNEACTFHVCVNERRGKYEISKFEI